MAAGAALSAPIGPPACPVFSAAAAVVAADSGVEPAAGCKVGVWADGRRAAWGDGCMDGCSVPGALPHPANRPVPRWLIFLCFFFILFYFSIIIFAPHAPAAAGRGLRQRSAGGSAGRILPAARGMRLFVPGLAGVFPGSAAGKARGWIWGGLLRYSRRRGCPGTAAAAGSPPPVPALRCRELGERGVGAAGVSGWEIQVCMC